MKNTQNFISKRLFEVQDQLLNADRNGNLKEFILNEENEITYTKDLYDRFKGCQIYITTGNAYININTVDMRVEGYYKGEHEFHKINEFDLLEKIDKIVKKEIA